MSEQCARHARIINHRHGTRFKRNGIQPAYRALTGFLPDGFRRVQIFKMARAVIGIVPLHAIALTGNHAGRTAIATGRIGSREAVAGCQRDDRPPTAGSATLTVGHARDGARGVFRLQRHFPQSFWRQIPAIIAINRMRIGFQDQFFRRKTGILDRKSVV